MLIANGRTNDLVGVDCIDDPIRRWVWIRGSGRAELSFFCLSALSSPGALANNRLAHSDSSLRLWWGPVSLATLRLVQSWRCQSVPRCG